MQAGIVLVSGLSWAEVREQFRAEATTHPVPKLLPPRRPINLDLSYPAKGQETGRHQHQAFLSACVASRGKLSPSEISRLGVTK